ncbi:MAG: glycosyltransferase [bacterium]|nr:glycosyltransferase [bacterium]
MKKKVLHLITGLGVGGAEMMLLRTLPLLQTTFDNEVCCVMGRGPVGEKIEEKGISVHYLDLGKYNFPIVAWRFVKISKQFKSGLLVTYLIHADIFGRILGRLAGVKKIISSQRGFYVQWKFLKKIDKWTSFLVAKYFVQTSFAKEVLMNELSLSADKFVVIPNAIKLVEYQFNLDVEKKKKELGIPNDNLCIICVSNLKPEKGYEELLEAFESVYSRNKKINLLVVGSGKEMTKYLNQIENYSSGNNIIFLGQRSDVKEILRLGEIFVLATYSEGMSNAILEAMASKLAIITTDIEVNREVIKDNVSGLLIPPRDAKSIEEKIDFLVGNYEKRRELGENAYREVLERFELNKVVDQIKDNYELVLYGR